MGAAAGILALRLLWFLWPLVQDLASDWRAPIARKAEQVHIELKRLALASSPEAEVWQFAELSIDSTDTSALAYWVVTQTDQERDRLASDARFQALLQAKGFAPDTVTLGFQSHETADRDFEGSWSRALGRSESED